MNGYSKETVELAYNVYETNYVKQEKCPIIFLHGFLCNKYMLKEVAEAMCKITKRKVFCLDLRCHGESPFREEQCSLEIMAEDVKRFIQDRKLEKVAFVCHSVSCTVAYVVLLDIPDAIEKIVMVDYPPFADHSLELIYKYVHPQFVAQERLLKILDTSLSLADGKKKFLNLSNQAEKEIQKLLMRKAAYELTKVDNQFKWKINYQFLINFAKQPYSFGTPRGRSDHEILIIRSKDSSLVTDKKFHAVLKYNPRATLKTIEDSTHLLMFEKTEEFLENVKKFLS